MNRMRETAKIAASVWDVADEHDLLQELNRLTGTTPVLDAYDRNDGHGLAVWCRYCLKWHVHGHGAGDRAANCHVEDSPYIKTGYVLKPIGRPVPTYKNERPKPPDLGKPCL